MAFLNRRTQKIYSIGELMDSSDISDEEAAEIVPIDERYFKDIPLLPVNIIGTICVCPSELYEGFFVAKISKLK